MLKYQLMKLISSIMCVNKRSLVNSLNFFKIEGVFSGLSFGLNLMEVVLPKHEFFHLFLRANTKT